MSRRYLALACALALGACNTTKSPQVLPPVADPCPAEGLAPVRAEPANPLTDQVERGSVYGAIAKVLGADRAQAVIRFWETEMPTWGRQGWERVKRTKDWCDNRK